MSEVKCLIGETGEKGSIGLDEFSESKECRGWKMANVPTAVSLTDFTLPVTNESRSLILPLEAPNFSLSSLLPRRLTRTTLK